jgi:DNA polymerase
MSSADRQAAIDALAFQLEAGVDVALDELPANRFVDQQSIAPAQGNESAEGPIERPFGSDRIGQPGPALSEQKKDVLLPAAEEAVTAAREAAGIAASLDELQAQLSRFEACALRFTATQLVFADGTPGSRVMLVGEAPGADEDREGLPFVGRSGKLLDRMLGAIGLNRTNVYIANIVPWRPPGNRTPTPQESAICLPFIRRQIELANPDFLVCLGRPSMQTLLGIKEGIRGVRGRWFDYETGTRTIRALVTFHPAYLLRSPLEKRHAWRDMLALKKALTASRSG